MILTPEILALAPFVTDISRPGRQGFVVNFNATRARVEWDAVSGNKRTWMRIAALREIKPDQARKTVTPIGGGKAKFDNGRETWIAAAPTA